MERSAIYRRALAPIMIFVGVVGIIADINKIMRFHFREVGRDLLMLQAPHAENDAHDAEIRFGSSEYAKEIFGSVWGLPPALNLAHEAALQKCVLQLVGQSLIESAHDCSDGGLATALAESSFVNKVGIKVSLNSRERAPEMVLFGEDASRILLSCDRNKSAAIKQLAVEFGLSAEKIGETTGDSVTISVDGQQVLSAPVSELKQVWSGALETALHT